LAQTQAETFRVGPLEVLDVGRQEGAPFLDTIWDSIGREGARDRNSDLPILSQQWA